MNKKILIIGIITIVLIGFYIFLHSGVKVTIRNTGTVPLYSLSVHVTGKTYDLGDIAPKETKSVVVNPKGESHIEIEHGKGDKRKVITTDCYLESGYKGKIVIDLDSEKALKIDNKIKIGI